MIIPFIKENKLLIKIDICYIITFLINNINNFGKMNEVYAGFFSEGNYPARSAFQVAALPKYALVEIEVVAVKSK